MSRRKPLSPPGGPEDQQAPALKAPAAPPAPGCGAQQQGGSSQSKAPTPQTMNGSLPSSWGYRALLQRAPLLRSAGGNGGMGTTTSAKGRKYSTKHPPSTPRTKRKPTICLLLAGWHQVPAGPQGQAPSWLIPKLGSRSARAAAPARTQTQPRQAPAPHPGHRALALCKLRQC